MRSYLIILFTLLLPLLVRAEEKVHLWQDTPVKDKSVTLEVFPPSPACPSRHTAVIVCPGGSYCWHDYKVEGTDVARWLSDNGFAAFVLNYRVQGKLPYVTHSRLIFAGNQHPYMITDMQRALQYVREHAREYDIERVGAMGFSAGGHLVMSAATFYDTDFLSSCGIEHTVSLRPDFVAPIYPVVSFSNPVSHKRSRRALLGEKGKNDPVMRDSLSLEKHVKADCPPVFLVNCKDDRVVKYRNSELLDSALTYQHIPHTYIQYQTGGHGFGASEKKGTAESRQWKSAFLKWINEL